MQAGKSCAKVMFLLEDFWKPRSDKMHRLVKKAGICLASFALLGCPAPSPVKEYEVKKEYAVNAGDKRAAANITFSYGVVTDYEVRFGKDSPIALMKTSFYSIDENANSIPDIGVIVVRCKAPGPGSGIDAVTRYGRTHLGWQPEKEGVCPLPGDIFSLVHDAEESVRKELEKERKASGTIPPF